MKPVRYGSGYAMVFLLILPLLVFAQTSGERPIQPGSAGERETPLEFLGLPKVDIGGSAVGICRRLVQL